MKPGLFLVFIFSLAACRRVQVGAMDVTLCDALSGDRTGGFTQLQCATGARIRLLPINRDDGMVPDGAEALADKCIVFGQGTPSLTLQDLFRTDGSGRQHPAIELGDDLQPPFVAEVALYAPTAAICEPPDTQPLVALGRSKNVTGAQPEIPVELGYRDLCQVRGNTVTLKAVSLELPRMPLPLAADAIAAIGEIFPYGAFLSTKGECVAPGTDQYAGSFRPMADQISAGASGSLQASGVFAFDQSSAAGCVAAKLPASATATTYACLDGPLVDEQTLALVSPQHLARLIARNPADAVNGVLVLQLVDGDTPVEGATVRYKSLSERNQAYYAQDADWNPTSGGNVSPTTSARGDGVAFFLDAPSGRYVVRWSADDNDETEVNAGGADDSHSITTRIVRRHPPPMSTSR